MYAGRLWDFEGVILLDVMQRVRGIVKESVFFMYAERFWYCEGVSLLYVMQRGSGTVKV